DLPARFRKPGLCCGRGRGVELCEIVGVVVLSVAYFELAQVEERLERFVFLVLFAVSKKTIDQALGYRVAILLVIAPVDFPRRRLIALTVSSQKCDQRTLGLLRTASL